MRLSSGLLSLGVVALGGSAVLLSAAPAQAVVTCTGTNSFGSAAGGSGADCGQLNVGQSFSIDVTDFFANLGTDPFDTIPYGVGAVKAAGAPLSFTNVGARVSGVAGGFTFTDQLIAIWGATADNPFGDVTYTTNGPPVPTLGAFRSVNFDLGAALAGLGSDKASPDMVGLTSVSSFAIEGTLASIGEGGPTIVSFGNGPGGIPSEGSTFSGYFTAVPGPLPLAGAGVAFAWSRSLRRRIKAPKASAPATTV